MKLHVGAYVDAVAKLSAEAFGDVGDAGLGNEFFAEADRPLDREFVADEKRLGKRDRDAKAFTIGYEAHEDVSGDNVAVGKGAADIATVDTHGAMDLLDGHGCVPGIGGPADVGAEFFGQEGVVCH